MIVYRARNVVNGKSYVGKTSRSLAHRVKEHNYAAHHGSKLVFHNAIRKHGSDNFEWSILISCSNDLELNDAERSMIIEHETMAPSGYNLTAGGDGMSGWKHSLITRQKMSASRSGEKHRLYGKHVAWGRSGPHSEVAKRKMCLAAIGRRHNDETKAKIGAATSIRKRKAVVQVSSDGAILAVHQSLQEAAIAVNGQPNKISEVLCGHRRTHKKFFWRYATECGLPVDRVEV